MKMKTLATYLNNDNPLNEIQADLVERCQRVLDKGYITRLDAVITIQEILTPVDYEV